MSHALTSFPPEILAQIIEYAGSHNIISLWKCGSYTLNAKIASGVKSIDLKDTSGRNRSRYPKMLSCFTKLEHLSVILGHELLMTPQSLSVELQQLPSTLLSLHLSSKDIDLAVLQYGPNSSESAPELEYLQYGDHKSPSWLGTKFPHMTSLSILGSKTSPDLLWPGLPPHLTSFSQCPGYRLTSTKNALHLLPRSLTTLHLNLEFDQRRFLSDAQLFCAHLPQSLTSITNHVSNPEASLHRNPDLVRKWTLFSNPLVSGISINERALQGTDQYEATCFELDSHDDIITSVVVRSGKTIDGIYSIVFSTAHKRYGPSTPAMTPFMTETKLDAPPAYGLTGLYVTSSPQDIVTEVTPIWGLTVVSKCEVPPLPPTTLDMNEIRTPKPRSTEPVHSQQPLPSTAFPVNANPELARTFCARADDWMNEISFNGRPAKGARHRGRSAYYAFKEPITRVDLNYIARSPPLSPKEIGGLVFRSNLGINYGHMFVVNAKKALCRWTAPPGHALIDIKLTTPQRRLPSTLEPIWGPIISPDTHEVNTDLVKDFAIQSGDCLDGFAVHGRHSGNAHGGRPYRYSMKEADEFITEVDIYYIAWHVSAYRTIGGYTLSSSSANYTAQLNRNHPFAIRRFIAPPGCALADMDVFLVEDPEEEFSLNPIWAPTHLPDPTETEAIAPQSTPQSNGRVLRPRRPR